MKKVIFHRDVQPDRGSKKFVLSEKYSEHDNITHVKKSFNYHINRSVRGVEPEKTQPDVRITKRTDQRRGLEMVKFEVRGKIHTRENQVSYEVIYHHVLNIHILWKNNKILSPNNTALN